MEQLDQGQLQKAFIHLFETIPGELKWVTLVTVDGLLVGSYPEQGDSARIAAITANLDALSERISSEFGNGGNRFTLVSGVDGLYLLLVIPGYYFIALNFAKMMSLDALLTALREALGPLSKVLGFPMDE